METSENKDSWLTSTYALNAIYMPHTFVKNNHIIVFVFIDADYDTISE